MSQAPILTSRLREERDYWLARLTGGDENVYLPPDHPRSKVYAAKEAAVALRLGAEAQERLKSLTGGSPFLVYTTLVAALKVCLHRYAGGEQVVVGSPALKGDGDAHSNALAVLDRVDERQTFQQLLLQVRDTLTQAYERQGYPYANLLEDLGLTGISDRCPLFSVAASLEEVHGALPALRCDLVFEFRREGGSLEGAVKFNARLHRRETVERFAGHYLRVLTEALSDVKAPVGDLTLTTEEERRQLVSGWNETAAEFPSGLCVHELFEAQAARTPDSVAVEHDGRRLTYAELNRLADGLARRLRGMGARPEARVGICSERTVETMVGLLAILKAGASYVPLDAAYPRERLAFMLEDARVPLLLAHESALAGLPEHTARVVTLNGVADPSDSAACGEHLDSGATPENLAYVLYTSGSTGRPKGVTMPHRTLVNLLTWQVGCSPAAARTLHFTSLSFDVSFQEIFSTWCAGGTLVLVAEQVRRDPVALRRALTEGRVERLFLPFIALQQLAELSDTQAPAPADLREVITAGEQLQVTRALVTLFRQLDGARLLNHYGPTEGHVVSSFLLEGAPSRWPTLPPIGRPIANARLYVTDARLRPLPVGVAGELLIGGASLARGYLGRPSLTAERFIPDPFSTEPGARLYRTGDRARLLPDGQIEFLGRNDHQLKVRGYRVEPGEIEAALAGHASVREAVVVAREDVPGDRRLVAYVVAREGRVAAAAELRDSLAQRLPEYMIPSHFVILDELPLTPSGKVDRRALPAPDRARPEADSFVAPRNDAEALLCKIWSEVLGLERVGVHDNFFELGGDSILTIQVVAKANRAGLALIPRNLFQHQTVAALAVAAQAGPATQGEQGEVTGPLPLTPIQHWFFEQASPEPQHFNMAYLFELREEYAPEVWAESVRTLLAHHDALRLRFVRGASGWEQSNDGSGGDTLFSRFDLSTLEESEHARAVTETAAALQVSLDLSAGPLLRVALFDFGGKRPSRLLFVIHHLAVDGVSWRILLEDLQTVVRAAGRGETAALPPKTTSFKEWARRLARHAQSEGVRQEASYWLARSGGDAGRPPVDFASGENLEATASVFAVSLDEAETEALLRDVPRAYDARINDVLLSALASAYARWAGGGSLLVDLEGHGREELGDDINLSRTVGWFTTVTRVLLELGGADTPGEALKAVREQLRRVPHNGIGYGLLRYLCEDEALRAALRAQPAAAVSFNYLGQTDQIFSGDSLLQSVGDSIGPISSPRARLPHLLYVSAIIFEGQLRVRFKYSADTFRAQTVGTLAEGFISELRALVAHCRAAGAADFSPADFPLARLDREELEAAFAQVGLTRVEDAYPLSPAQEGILFHSLYEPASGVYVTQMSCAFGSLDEAAVGRAWATVVARHPVLRTAFAWGHAERPLQVVAERVELPLEVRDWRALDAVEQKARFDSYLREDRQRGFDLARAPLMRLALFRTGDDAWRFVWSHHHVLLDGWSIFLILKEVFALYDSYCGGQEPALEPAAPFRDYLAWLQGRSLTDSEAFWRRLLAGFKTPTPMGVDRPAEQGAGEGYAEQRMYLPAGTLAELQAFARSHRVTLNTLAQGAWALLLGHYADRREVVFGATVSGRPVELEGVEAMVGIFINVLPMRAALPPELGLLEWLGRVQEAHAELRQYEYTPLAQVQRWSEVARGAALFESILTFQNYPVDDKLGEHSSSLDVSDVRHSSQTNYPLTIIVGPGHELLVRAIYDGRRFARGAVARLLEDLASLLRLFVERPEASLGELRAAIRPRAASPAERTAARPTAARGFTRVKPKTVRVGEGDLVRSGYLSPDSTFPLVFEPNVEGVDLAEWVAGRRATIEEELARHGALLFRGFGLNSVGEFERFAQAVCPDLFGDYGDLPREGVGGKVYRSTPYPADKAILTHNESSHLARWPMKLCFYCVEAARQGGETPLVDCRKLYRLLDPSLREHFENKQVMYVRNYIEGIDVSWQSFFRTDERAEVERFCAESDMQCHWGEGGRLRTSQVRPAVTRHPKTGEPLFFNQLQLHHISCLDSGLRESLLGMYRLEDLPRNVYYGDGTPIEDSVIERIRELSLEATVAFPWRAGDALVLDNMLVAHGRNPYDGPRKVVVAMGEMVGDASLPHQQQTLEAVPAGD